MKINNLVIRRALEKDIDQILILLSDVLEIHAQIRPDIFISGTTKYSKEDILKKINNDEPIYVAVDEDILLGYAFCEIKKPAFSSTMKSMKIFYIDDFVVNKNYRHQYVGENLFNYVKQEAKAFGCYEICLSAWEGNETASKFYEKMGLKVKSKTMEYILK